MHWQWVDPETDDVLTVDPGRDEYVGGQAFVGSLRSREAWPTTSGVGDLPQFAVSHAEEVPSAVGGHIARHDPARVLREVDAKRRLIRTVFVYEAKIDGEWGDCHSADEIEAGLCLETDPDEIEALRLLALSYSDHPDFQESWRP